MYDIEWIRSVDNIDLCMIHLLSLCRLYRYNLRNDPEKSIQLSQAEARHITRVTVLLRTKQGEPFKSVYYLPHEQAELFRDRLIEYFTNTPKKGSDSS